MAETIDDRVNANASPEQQEKPKGLVANAFSELSDFVKKTLVIGSIAAMPFLYYPFAPAHVARAAVTTYGFAAGKVTANIIQNQDPLKGAPRQAFFGDILSAPLAIGFTQLNNLESTVAANYGTTAAKAAKVGALIAIQQPAISTMRTGLEYGVGKEFRKNWWPDLKDVYKFITIFAIPNVLWVYQYGLFPQMAVSAAISYVLSLTKALRQAKGSIKNLFNALNPTLYIGAAASLSYKLVGNLYTGINDIGKAIGGGYVAKPATPQTAQAPTLAR